MCYKPPHEDYYNKNNKNVRINSKCLGNALGIVRDIEAHKKREEELEVTIALMETERGEANSNVMKNAEETLIYDLEKDALIRKLQVTALKYRLKLYSPSFKVTPRSSLEDRVWDDVEGVGLLWKRFELLYKNIYIFFVCCIIISF